MSPQASPPGEATPSRRPTGWPPTTPTAATADIVTEGPASNSTTAIAVTRIHVVWQRGDWRVVAPLGGNWANSATTASSLRGYTAFPNER